jgi:phosphoribosyl 1,2-cyclic phosphodiesterase
MRRLELIHVRPETLNALIITHEHLDHIRGAGPIARRFDLPVHINPSTLRKGSKIIGNLSRPVPIHPGRAMTIGDLLVEPFTKCHDAADPMGVVVSSDGAKLALITDLGRSTGLVQDRLKGCRAIIMEFNHDEEMLDEGPYPLALRRRIKGPDGHLSNRQAAELLKAVSHEDLAYVILAHLSKVNNQPEKALREAKGALKDCGLDHTKVLVGRQDHPLPLMMI